MPAGIGYPSSSTITPVAESTGFTSRPKPTPRKPDTQQDEMMRVATRILARGGTKEDVASMFHNGYGVTLPGYTPTPDVQTPGKVQGLSMNALQGVTFGYGDEAVGGIFGLLDGTGWQTGIDDYRQELRQFNAENKKAALAAEIAGGLMLGGTGAARSAGRGIAGMGTAGRVGSTIGLGAAGGAAYGAGNAQGGLSERARGLVVGGTVGAVAGAAAAAGIIPALTLAGAGVGAIADSDNPLTGAAKGAGVTLALATAGKVGGRGVVNWAQRLANVPKENRSVSKAAREIWAEAIQRDYGSLDNAIQAAEKLTKTGAPITLADVAKENGASLVQSAAALRGPGKQRLVEELVTRQAEQGDRMLSGLFRATKLGVQNAYDAADEIIALGRAASARAYGKAYTQQVQVSPPIAKALRHPKLQEAYEMGRLTAASEDLAEAAHEGALKVPALAVDEKGVITNATLPVRALDYMKRGVDALIRRGAESGKVLDKQEARALRKLMSEAIHDAEQQVPYYQSAKQIFQGEREALETIVLGKGGKSIVDGVESTSVPFHNRMPSEIMRDMVLLSPTDKKLYVLGAMQDVAEWLGEITAQAPNVAQKLGGNVYGKHISNIEQRVRFLFDDPDLAQEFMDYVKAEARISATTGRLGGSRTAPLLEGMAELTGAAASKGATVNLNPGTVLKSIQNRANVGWTDAASDEVSALALRGLSGKDELLATLESLRPHARVVRPTIPLTIGAQASQIP